MLRKPSIFARLVDKIRSLPQIIAPHVRGRFEKKPGAGLGLKADIRIAPATHARPVEAIVRATEQEDRPMGATPGAKRVVRVLSDGRWIKKL